MKRLFGCILCVLFATVFANATLTIHLQSPYRNDAVKGVESIYTYHITGEVTDWNADFNQTSRTRMTPEGDHWYSYTWNKTVADYPNGGGLKINICTDTADVSHSYQNKCDLWNLSDGMMFKTLFQDEVEVWLYTDGSTYTKSFVPPGSKLIWFKSPWGNRALPQMIFGADTVVMRFANNDSAYCGWFYGAITPSSYKSNAAGSVYFQRYMTPYMSYPENGVLELGSALAANDTIFIDGIAGDGSALASMSSVGECFDSSRTLHVYSPWRHNSTFRDSAVYLYAGNVANNRAMTNEGEYKYWWHYNFPDSVVKGNEWKSARVNFSSAQNAGESFWAAKSWEADTIRPYISTFFPKGIYETWIFTNTNGTIEQVYSPLEEKVIRLLSPWTNMSPMMMVEGDTVKMGPFSKDTCGWYQGVSYKHIDSWELRFRQTFGFEYFGALGTSETYPDPFILDSIFAVQDTVWIQSIPLKISESYTGHLGDCPTMKISAMVVDWAGESFPDSIDVDFGAIYDGNPYTTVLYTDSLGNVDSTKVCHGLVQGMVQDTLVNGLPARVDSAIYPWEKCSAAHEIEKWFVPTVLATDAQGNEYTNAVCRDVELTLDEEGFWLADITNENGCNDTLNPGFYPVDDFEYLDSAHTIKNPKNDKYVEHQGCRHNYSYAMKVTAQFQYVKGQYFEFRGDDDVWVYINNRLVVDIGGCHNPEKGAVNLDTLGLVEGETYPFHIFYSERNATGANFKMRTSINLQTQKTFYKEAVTTADGTIQYNLKQMLVDESLSCDVSSIAHVEVKDAASSFLLTGGNLPEGGVTLDAGVNYGGISINEYMSGFTIDTAAIVASRSLYPGTYVLFFFLASDLTQYDRISFTVPEFPLPDIAFADSLGNPIDPDTVQLGTFAFVLNPVYVRITESTNCSGNDDYCKVVLRLATQDSLYFYDEDSNIIDSVETDVFGFAKFYVMSDMTVDGASFKVSGIAVSNEIVWKNIHLEKPPVPNAINGYMFDRNGDGMADSLHVAFSESFAKDIPDTLDWVFGDNASHMIASEEAIRGLVQNDSIIVIDNYAMTKDVFTGNRDDIYKGVFKYHYTHIDDSTGMPVPFSMTSIIQDKIGPVIEKAVIIPQSDSYSILTVTFSEGVEYSD